MKNVIITPHFSAPSEKFMDRAFDVFCENIRRFQSGEELKNIVPLNNMIVKDFFVLTKS